MFTFKATSLPVCLSEFLSLSLSFSHISDMERTLHVCSNLHITSKQYGSYLEFTAIRSVYSGGNAPFQATGKEEEVGLALISDWDILASFLTEASALERRRGKLNCVVQQQVTTCFLKLG